jgi:23S rRNA C2498 (ribose-2'-O)-methylase RlmM
MLTPFKKVIYQAEDTVLLGKSLPLVAHRQLLKIVEKLRAMPHDERLHYEDAEEKAAQEIEKFCKSLSFHLDDEREMKKILTRYSKEPLSDKVSTDTEEEWEAFRVRFRQNYPLAAELFGF